MASNEDEEALLRSVALRNAQSILQARQRAEQELVEAKDALERKSAELARSLALVIATLESTTDGIIVTDGRGEVTGYNERLAKMWGFSREILDTRTHPGLLETTSRFFADPARFMERIREIYASSPPESFDVLELADGRVFERYSRIQTVDGANVGRVWSFRDITERRRAQLELQAQSEWLRVTLASIGDAVITTDTDGRVTSLNPVAEALTGWPLADAQGRMLDEVFRIINEQTREAVESPALRSLREGHIVGLANHTVLIARDGAERAIDDSAAPIQDASGRVLGAVLIFRDVSERRRAEESQIHMTAVVDSSDDAIVSKSLEGIIRSWNEGAKRVFGYEAEEVIGKPITILLPAERHSEETEILRRLRRGERLDHFETIRVHKDGHWIDVSVTASPVRDSSGHIIGASKIARDITHRKRTERTAHFLAEASAALVELDDEHATLQRVATLSVPAFADWCAVDRLDTHGLPQRLAFARSDTPEKPPDTAVAIVADSHPGFDLFGVAGVLENGQPKWSPNPTKEFFDGAPGDDADVRYFKRYGLKSFLCVPIRSRAATFGAITFARTGLNAAYDIDDLRAAQDLARRTMIAVENANLVSALKESDKRKDEFLAMLAHELRNPLAPIGNAVHLVKAKGVVDPDLRWATDIIERQVRQLTRLVDDLLDVSRITSGKLQLRIAPVQLSTVVQGAIDGSRPLIDGSGHELIVTMPPEPIHLDGDSLRLSQALLNLLNNAAKYTDPGGRIWLTVRREGDQAEIRVKDNGIGIAAAALPHIFDLFTQDDRSLERSQGGLGIGLMLVRRLVELHGGTVSAHSAGPGRGSEFVVRLPIPSAADSARRSGSVETRDVAAKAEPRLILVVDDNKDAADSLTALLRTMGHTVRTARDGVEAVAIASEFRPELVLLDIGLPKMNGYDVARQIRQERRTGVVLVAITGWGQEGDRRKSLEAGFDVHVTKPIEIETLKALLDRLSRGAGTAPEVDHDA